MFGISCGISHPRLKGTSTANVYAICMVVTFSGTAHPNKSTQECHRWFPGPKVCEYLLLLQHLHKYNLKPKPLGSKQQYDDISILVLQLSES